MGTRNVFHSHIASRVLPLPFNFAHTSHTKRINPKKNPKFSIDIFDVFVCEIFLHEDIFVFADAEGREMWAIAAVFNELLIDGTLPPENNPTEENVDVEKVEKT